MAYKNQQAKGHAQCPHTVILEHLRLIKAALTCFLYANTILLYFLTVIINNFINFFKILKKKLQGGHPDPKNIEKWVWKGPKNTKFWRFFGHRIFFSEFTSKSTKKSESTMSIWSKKHHFEHTWPFWVHTLKKQGQTWKTRSKFWPKTQNFRNFHYFLPGNTIFLILLILLRLDMFLVCRNKLYNLYQGEWVILGHNFGFFGKIWEFRVFWPRLTPETPLYPKKLKMSFFMLI